MSPTIRPDDTVTIDDRREHWTVDAIYPATPDKPARVGVVHCKDLSRSTRNITVTEVAPERVTYVRRGNTTLDAANELLAALELPQIAPGGGAGRYRHYVLADGHVQHTKADPTETESQP